MSTTWDEISPGMTTGFGAGQADQGSGGVSSGVTGAAVTRAGSDAPAWSPDNPMFWVGGLLLLIVGAVTVSTSVDLGPLRGKAKI